MIRLFKLLFQPWIAISLIALIALSLAVGLAQAGPIRPANRPVPAAVAKPVAPAMNVNRAALNPQPLPPVPGWPPTTTTGPRFGMWGFQKATIHPQPQPNRNGSAQPLIVLPN